MKPLNPRHEIEGIKTRQMVFILGHSLGHSLSPAMQNAAFERLGLPWSYMPLEVRPDQVKTAVDILRAINVRGANVTVPYKEAALHWLDRVEPEAGWLGSVNTVYRSGKKLCGASTDGEGFLQSLGPWRRKLRGSAGLLLGAGGAGKAVAGALARSGVKGFFVVD
jgi:shikimate dehydrogenase